jgi:hypothetical protein
MGQKTNAPRVGIITGTVRDSGTVRYTRRFSVCTWIPEGTSTYSFRCADTDSLGSYRLSGLPPIRLLIGVQCETINGFGKALASDSIGFHDTIAVRRNWAVSTNGCDPRPIRRVANTFRGRFSPGFESSEFVPCKADAWFTPNDSLETYPFDARFAWVAWSAAAYQRVKWPRAPKDRHGNPVYYVRWHGTVVGPGRYGHLGVAPFEFVVDSVLEMRPPRKGDCR